VFNAPGKRRTQARAGPKHAARDKRTIENLT
jgi:hypothetical protein